ncbi:hypothetical protein [Sulfurimonas diazotrophicus]|uniref:DUF481 domain-containing protein n=1 Tax=Sulfurimonas diazotrophicus TaxID=3131939 RepID=A0ABZ3H9N6_9BACT
MKRGSSLCALVAGIMSAFFLVLNPARAHAEINTATIVNASKSGVSRLLDERQPLADAAQHSILETMLKGADIKLKVFESDDNASTSLGFEYEYSRDIAQYAFRSEKATHTGLALNFSASGNVAFEQSANPRNLTDTRFSFGYYFSTGGVLPGTPDFALLNRLEDAAAEANTTDELRQLSAWKELAKAVRNQLSDQYYFDLSVKGGLEADQSFKAKQYYYGLYANMIAKGWNAETSVLAQFNILDYPAALLRLLSGVDDTWQPRGSSFPEFLIGIDQVDPDSDTPRQIIAGDESSFTRMRFEASFRTLAATYNDADAFIEANYRYYQEINPSSAVKAAGLDTYSFFTVALVMPEAEGLYVSYSDGKLPLDRQNDQVYELGFKYKF